MKARRYDNAASIHICAENRSTAKRTSASRATRNCWQSLAMATFVDKEQPPRYITSIIISIIISSIIIIMLPQAVWARCVLLLYEVRRCRKIERRLRHRTTSVTKAALKRAKSNETSLHQTFWTRTPYSTRSRSGGQERSGATGRGSAQCYRAASGALKSSL
jgi:uncharacterized membrane protein YgcG